MATNDTPPPMSEREQWEARRWIALAHEDNGKCQIYGDDGELYCGNVHRHGRAVDFLREPLADIINILQLTQAKEAGILTCEENPAQIEQCFKNWKENNGKQIDK